MNLENLLGQIQTDGGNLLHGTVPPLVAFQTTTTFWHFDAGGAGPFHLINLGDVMDFFELSDRDAHWLLCDCHHVGTMTGDSLAKRLRHHARWSQFRAGWRETFRRLLDWSA